MVSYVASGCAAAWVFSRKAAIDWQTSMWLAFGAMPGARVAQRIRTRVLSRVVAVLMIAFGVLFVACVLTAP